MYLSQLNTNQIFTFPNRRGEYIFEGNVMTHSGKYVLYRSRRMGKIHIEEFAHAEKIEVETVN